MESKNFKSLSFSTLNKSFTTKFQIKGGVRKEYQSFINLILCSKQKVSDITDISQWPKYDYSTLFNGILFNDVLFNGVLFNLKTLKQFTMADYNKQQFNVIYRFFALDINEMHNFHGNNYFLNDQFIHYLKKAT